MTTSHPYPVFNPLKANPALVIYGFTFLSMKMYRLERVR